MSKALGIILLRMVGAMSGHPYGTKAMTSDKVSEEGVNGDMHPCDCAGTEASQPLLPGPVHPRMGGPFLYGGPFSGKIRRKAK